MKKTAIVYSIVKSVIDSPHTSVMIILILIDQIEIDLFHSLKAKLAGSLWAVHPQVYMRASGDVGTFRDAK